jgi:hypothetical protein
MSIFKDDITFEEGLNSIRDNFYKQCHKKDVDEVMEPLYQMLEDGLIFDGRNIAAGNAIQTLINLAQRKEVEDNPMLCPCCKEKLVVTGQDHLETLGEHVGNPNALPMLKDEYECPNKECPTFGRASWTSGGEYFSEEFGAKFPFIDDNHGPFGSLERQLQIEIYKKDENFDWFEIGKWKIHVKYIYKSDKNGKILSRKRKHEIWKSTGDDFGGYTLHIPGIHMLMFSIKSFHRSRKTGYGMKDHTDKNNSQNQGDWWRVWSCNYARAFTKIFGRKDRSMKLSEQQDKTG